MNMTNKQKNWAGNITFSAVNWHKPQTISELQELVAHYEHVKMVGSRHSFNRIADSPYHLVSLDQIGQTMDIDPASQTVTVSAGVRYGELGAFLHQHGFALANMASLPHISVVGACATATHGSGEKNGNLATAITSLEFIAANGEIHTLSRETDSDFFPGAVVNVGALGVITKITLAIQPTFDMTQVVYENLPIDQLNNHFDDIQAAAYSVSLFTDWRGDTVNQIWLKRSREDAQATQTASRLLGATLADGHRHPLVDHEADNCTEQMGIPGPWYERLPHFRMDFTPSSGAELQSEYFVGRQDAIAAIQAIQQIQESIAPHLRISEIRTIAADDLWLSPCYQQQTVAFHFTWQPNWPAVRQVLPLLEAQLSAFNGRPHWGKLFTMAPARLPSLYPKLPAFRQLCEQYDPHGKFRNAFLISHIWQQNP